MRRRLRAAASALVVLLATGVSGVVGAQGAAGAAGAAPAAAAPPVGAPRSVPLPPGGRDGQWWFTTWRIEDVWATGAQGQGVTVAILDSGVNRLPELRGALLPGSGGPGGDGRTDRDGHGTQMALLVAAQGGARRLVGVAPRAKILPVVAAPAEDGIRWAVDHGAKVVSMSFGDTRPCDRPLADAVAYALGKGAVLVASTGNKGGSLANGSIYAPVNCPGVLGVGAVDVDARPWARTQPSPFADVAAPGVHMRTIGVDGAPGYSDGTSDATALVSGAVALVWSRYPELTNRQVVARLLATARDAGDPGRDDRTGVGIVRPYQAITTDVPPDAPNAVFDELTAAAPTASASAGAAAPGVPVTDPGTGPDGLPGGLAGVLPWALLGAVVVVGGLVLVVLAVVLGRRRAGKP